MEKDKRPPVAAGAFVVRYNPCYSKAMEKDYTRAITSAKRVLNAWLPYKIQYDRIPGLSVGIVHNGTLVYQKGFGYADLEKKIPATANTSYRIASISKTFTAVAIMQLVEKGKIRLDDTVQHYLPWFRAKSKDGDAANITIRQLLSHTAGVFRDGVTPHWVTDHFPDAAALRRSVSRKTVVYENLTRFKYSNFGLAVLGQVIQKASGVSYNTYVTNNIIKRLGMERTAPDYTKKVDAWLAQGYSRPIPGIKREAFRHAATNTYAPATGFLSNVHDLAKYLSALSLKRNKPLKLLGRESKKVMMKEFWSEREDDRMYGLGFSVWKNEKRKIIGHGGGFAGFITQMSLDVENDIGVIVLSNSNDSSASEINDGILTTIYSFVDKTVEMTAGKKLRHPEKYEGAYRSRWGDEIVVYVENKLIAFDPQTNSPMQRVTVLSWKEKQAFLMETKVDYDSPGELARFVLDKKLGKAKKLFWGSMPLDRIVNG